MNTKAKQQRQDLLWSASALLSALAILVLQEIIFPLVAGLVLAYALNPLADSLECTGVGRLGAAALTVALLVSVFIFVLLILVPLLLRQAQQIMASLRADLESIRPQVAA